MVTKKSSHIHKYERRWADKAKKVEIWACARPRCTHYLFRMLAIGRASECWYCGKEMTLNPKNMLRKHPKCSDCRKPKKDKSRAIESIMEELKMKFGM